MKESKEKVNALHGKDNNLVSQISKTPYILNMSDVMFPSPTPNNPFPSLRTLYMPYLAYQIVSTLLGGDVDLSQHFSHSATQQKLLSFKGTAGNGARAGFISESFNIQFNPACFER